MGPSRKLSALVVDDEPSLVRVVEGYLIKDGFDVRTAGDGETALELARESEPDLVVLDLGLPGIDGVAVCRQLRTFSRCYILMLTARADEIDVLIGLGVGADDYVTKPFSARELLARVRVLGRRAAPEAGSLDEVQAGDATVDLLRMVVMRGEARSPLTPREVGIVRWLYTHRARVVTRAELLEQVFGQRGDLQTRAVDMAIAVLRKKLESDPAHPTVIVSVKGAGYAWGPTR